MSRIIIVGAGLAGLASGVWLAKKGYAVSLYEASGYAGGRCRSWYDEQLGCNIDNGNHLILGANKNTLQYSEWISSHTKHGLKAVHGPVKMLNLNTRESFQLAHRRLIQGIDCVSHLPLLHLMMFPGRRTVSSFFSNNSNLFQNIVRPLCISALNTDPERASAKLLASVLWAWVSESAEGGEFRLPETTLGDALIEGALKTIKSAGGSVRYQTSLKRIEKNAQRVTQLYFYNETLPIDENTSVILALPPWGLQKIDDSLAVPLTYHPIVNGHFKLDLPEGAIPSSGFLGLIEGTADWLFYKDHLISTTTSAADNLLTLDHDEIANLLWKDIRSVHPQLQTPLPPHRIIVEKRATFSATPENLSIRPGTSTYLNNLFLAGDYTQTHMPATIESAITSGFKAASCVHRK